MADVSAWSRLTGMREVTERLRPRLRSFRDQRGRELLDLPDPPRPDPETPAPARFLPEFDNALLSHADRSRLVDPSRRAELSAASGPVHGTALHDGTVCAVWRLERERGSGAATLVVSHVRLSVRTLRSVAAEGRRLLGLIAADAEAHEVRMVSVPR